MAVRIHFLNVGSGDCTIIHFPPRTRKDGKMKPERVMMVDINHHEDHDEYENVLDYYKHNIRNNDGELLPIFRFVCTHPHQDHICGLRRLFDDQNIRIFNFWDLAHSFTPDGFEHHATHKDDWTAYEQLRGADSPATVIRTSREGDARQFWNDDEDRITILSPVKALRQYAHFKEDGTERKPEDVEIDEMSYALSIKINERGVILAGDGRTTPCWEDIYEHCKQQIKNTAVLKAGHHGQETSFHENAVKLMNPALIVFSNSTGEDKDNGAEEQYKKAVPTALLLKTCDAGTISVTVPYNAAESITYSKAI